MMLQSAPLACGSIPLFANAFIICHIFYMYDILGCEQHQGDQDTAGCKESNSLRLHNDVHKVMAMHRVFMACGGI
jgi:hypothetical protein